MLYLIYNGKVGKNVNLPEWQNNWRSLFKESEDSLTSSVFTRLFYLPAEYLWDILYNACYDSCLPKQAGKILEKYIWPRWNSEGTVNVNFVEPDVFIRFEEFDLIIEAKRYDDIQQQYSQQWNDQIIAYRNEYGQDHKKTLYFIALGGLLPGCEKQDCIGGVTVTKCRWKRILHQINLKLGKSKNLDDSVLFILQDLILSFRIHGFLTGQLLNTLPTGIKIRNMSLSKISTISRLTCFNLFPKNLRYINSKHITKLYGATFKI